MTERVIAIGSRDRGDDGVGPAVADEVARRVGSSAGIVVTTAEPSRLIDHWSDTESVVLVDAVVDGSEPGTIRVVDAMHEPLPDDGGAVSSHGMGVGAAVALGRSLDRLPARLVLVGVSAGGFEGPNLSEPVARAVAGAADIVMEMFQHA